MDVSVFAIREILSALRTYMYFSELVLCFVTPGILLILSRGDLKYDEPTPLANLAGKFVAFRAWEITPKNTTRNKNNVNLNMHHTLTNV